LNVGKPHIKSFPPQEGLSKFTPSGLKSDNSTAMNKINKAWHEMHRMPKNAKLSQRIAWHLAHQLHCSCRPIPKKIAEEIKKRGIA